jgi:hypothetical protein
VKPEKPPTLRELPDWLSEFMETAKWGEAPPYFYFWTGVATIAAALQRRTWLPMGTFTWYPNLYTILVAPPGIVQKSSTSDLGMRLLKQIPGVHQGPTTLTWQSLYDAFQEVGHEFEISPTETATQFPLYINSSELGITLKMQDTEMVDQLVHMWDGYELKKRTRMDGEMVIPTPSLNLIACTTPSWIAENVPAYLIGGGLTSRMLFVYGEHKERYVAYPQRHIPADYVARQSRLVRDLERIHNLVGAFSLTEDAYKWGEDWYEDFHKNQAPKLDKTLIGGYIARKQTLVHKVAMILTVSLGDSLVISRQTLERSAALISQLEEHMPKVYSRIGMTADANAAQQILAFLERYDGKADFNLLYRYMHRYYSDPVIFENVLKGMIEANLISINKSTREVIKS